MAERAGLAEDQINTGELKPCATLSHSGFLFIFIIFFLCVGERGMNGDSCTTFLGRTRRPRCISRYPSQLLNSSSAYFIRVRVFLAEQPSTGEGEGWSLGWEDEGGRPETHPGQIIPTAVQRCHHHLLINDPNCAGQRNKTHASIK